MKEEQFNAIRERSTSMLYKEARHCCSLVMWYGGVCTASAVDTETTMLHHRSSISSSAIILAAPVCHPGQQFCHSQHQTSISCTHMEGNTQKHQLLLQCPIEIAMWLPLPPPPHVQEQEALLLFGLSKSVSQNLCFLRSSSGLQQHQTGSPEAPLTILHVLRHENSSQKSAFPKMALLSQTPTLCPSPPKTYILKFQI